MNTKTFTYLLANPQNISQEHQRELSEILDKYPYFQSARALQLKGLKNSNSFLYNDALKVTAAYTTDRNILFEYITSDYFIQNEISEIIQQHDESVTEIEVVSEDVSEQISVEIDNQIKAELKKAEAILNPNLFLPFDSAQDKLRQESNESTIEDDTVSISSKNMEAHKQVPASPRIGELQTNKPLDFKKEDAHSFSEWLQLTSAKPIVREEKASVTSKKQEKFDLIDRFIQDKPKLVPTKTPSEGTKTKNLASQHIQAPEANMTETLAKVYLQQKNYKKAIVAYKILILKYPEKSGFFADQIRAIHKQINLKDS
ncbi:MAG: hypothetical protein COB12_04575 [Flavobacterium sp.]|nr:MAG: hypothetical protein COB12_04575 [Flavobacterium sp.]